MKKIAQLIAFMALIILTGSGCSHKISITRRQAATMSPQAVDTLKSFKVVRLPIIKTSDKLLLKTRAKLAAVEAGQLKEMMARFNPTIADTVINGVKVKIITPAHINPAYENKIAIYIHGGGFIMGSATDRTGMLMTNEMGIKTYSIDYQLAPEAKFPVAMNECLAVYRYLIQRYRPEDITGWSISAGGTHMLAMLVKAKQEGLPMINSIALLSPATDISGNGDAARANDGRDLLAYRNQGDKMFVVPFVGNANVTDSLVSPVYANYTNDFPATIIATSTRDLFLSNSVREYWKLKDAHVNTELLVAEGMWHAFQSYSDLPEALQNRKAAQDFLFNNLTSVCTQGNAHSKRGNDTLENIQLVKRFIANVVNQGKIDMIDELWSKDMAWHGGSLGNILGRDNYKAMARASVNGAFNNMHLQILEIVASGDKVVVYFQNSGENKGPFMGHQPTGKKAAWNGMGIYRIANGQISEAWFSEDLLQMFSQLGFIKL